MILILSNESCSTTNHVIDRLLSFNLKFLRINTEDKIELEWLDLNNSSFKINGILYQSNQFHSIWYYRGKFNINYSIKKDDRILEFYRAIKNHLTKELLQVEYLFVNTFKGKILGNYFIPNSNKIKALLIAKKYGLNIPETEIITQRNYLLKKIDKNRLITKGIQDSATLEFLDYKSNVLSIFNNYSSIVNKGDIEKFPDTFFPTQIQTYVDKQFELRIFYLNKKCYAIAIFSQRNEKTKVDFRQYDNENENKVIPFSLPRKIEFKITLLMEEMQLNTGSLDMIVDKDGKYTFLEINPVGLFEVVDYYGKYNLYDKITNYLL